MSTQELLAYTSPVEPYDVQPDIADDDSGECPPDLPDRETGDEAVWMEEDDTVEGDDTHETITLPRRDSEDLIRIQAGNNDALGDIYERHHEAVGRFLRYRVPPHLAEDLTSETFYRAARAMQKGTLNEDGAFDRRGGARPWLTTIARNIIADHYKSAWTRNAALLPSGPQESDLTLENVSPNNPDTITESAERTAIESIHQEEVRVALAGLIEQLTPNQRDIIMMRFYDGLRHKEVAEKTGLNVGATKAAQNRAIGSLLRYFNQSDNPYLRQEALERMQSAPDREAPASTPQQRGSKD